MAKTNDTIDGLLVEFRGYSSGMPPSYHVTMSWADFRKMLDRFEAARKRMEWTHKKELETRDAVIQTEVAAREAEREAHKREIDEVVALATRYRTALARINALATYCCQPNVREQIIEQCETISAAERNGKTKETEMANDK